MGSKCFAQPQNGDAGLAADAHRVRLAGPIGDLRYPPLCPNCGAAASTALTVSKVFYDDPGADTPTSRVIVDADPLFCSPCIERHRTEAIPPTSADTLRTVFLSDEIIPAVMPLLGGLFVLGMAGTFRGQALLVGGGLAAFFFLISWSCWRSAWTGTRWKRVPAQTSISRAFDFGHDDSTMYKTAPRTYAFRNGAYAEAFGALNAALDARWLGPEQKARERRRTWVMAAILAGLALLALWLQSRHG